MRYLLIVLMLLVGCGGGGAKKTEVVIVEPEPVKQATFIYNNKDYLSLSGVGFAYSDGYEYIYTKVTYDAVERQRVINCGYACFSLSHSVIIGGNKDCEECLRLSDVIIYAAETGLTVFIEVSDELTLGFAESITSSLGYSDLIIASDSRDLLDKSLYNYPLALIGSEALFGIDYLITDDINHCSNVSCVASESESKENKGFDYAIINH